MKKLSLNPLIIGFTVSLLILIISIGISVKTIDNSYGYFNWVDHTYLVIKKLKDAEYELRQAESDSRSYSIFKQSKYITDYKKDTANVKNLLNELKVLTSDNEKQQKNIASFEVLVNKRIAMVNSRFSPDFDEKEFQLKKNASARLQLRKSLNEASKDIENMERVLLKERQQLAYVNLSGSKITILISGFISFVISILVVFLLYRDIEKRKKIEEELIQLNQNKNKFFSIISHDLRGPVKGISALTKMIMDNKIYKEDDAKELFFHLNSSAEKASDLLDNLLTWARSQMDKIRFEPETINLKDEVNTGIANVVNSAAEKQIDIRRQIHEDIFVLADQNMIAMVIRNLLQNAIKFTHSGGIIVVDIRIEKEYAITSIKDNGVGIGDGNIRKLFEINSGYTTKGTALEEGTGLGLVLCKEFVVKNNGKIWVESKEGQGTTFYFSLPLIKKEWLAESNQILQTI